VAIIFRDNGLLHCYPEDGTVRDGLIGPGITIDPEIGTSHGWDIRGYYKYAFPPELWLVE